MIMPEGDPNPSWTFYPPSATFIPHIHLSTTGPTSPRSISPHSPSRSPRSSPPPSSSVSNETTEVGSNSSSTPTTHHRILDHCFHLSIETRLKQAEAQYRASIQEQAAEQQGHDPNQDETKQADWRRRQRSLVDEAVVLGRKGSNVEAIVDGILKSHRSNGPLQTLPRHLKHRLHLCQLTSMVFGRFDVASSTNSAGLNIYSAFHSRRHGASRAAIRARFAYSEQGQQIQTQWTHSIPSSSYCRRHHRKDCKRTCCTLAKLQQEQQQALELKKKLANNYYMNNARKQEHHRIAGLVDAIPAFLKCSAMSYRDIAKSMVDHGELKEIKEMKVLDGWYRLLLEIMTQAVIESYLCDENTGFDTILDVFSFGEDPDSNNNQEKTHVNIKPDLDALGNSSVSSAAAAAAAVAAAAAAVASTSLNSGMEGLQFSSGLGSSTTSTLSGQKALASHGIMHDVTTQDRQDDILFAKTPEYLVFKQAKDERLQEFFTLNGKTMEQHFADLAAKHPLIVFERQMTHFISRSQKLLVDPKLSANKEPLGLLIPPTTSAYADGSLSMPVSEDEDDDEDMEKSGMKLEEIKEEDEGDENETIDEQKKRQQQRSVPFGVVIKGEMKKAKHTRHVKDGSGNDSDDDDNSTAARVVQVSKKHKHPQAQSKVVVKEEKREADGEDTRHVAKKVKV
ncbi:hypothetical protein BG011_004929 [Mortierella polycephala]|uniref:Uncharacterized protein n=1 Tax=Mortierella polycephala TaxID=41804 RepID=A0A9P6PWZ6_9FUNG|nr:hypothetical protein BG011_004929 [Mortierella polycephala]